MFAHSCWKSKVTGLCRQQDKLIQKVHARWPQHGVPEPQVLKPTSCITRIIVSQSVEECLELTRYLESANSRCVVKQIPSSSLHQSLLLRGVRGCAFRVQLMPTGLWKPEGLGRDIQTFLHEFAGPGEPRQPHFSLGKFSISRQCIPRIRGATTTRA